MRLESFRFILVPRASWGPEHEDQEALGTQDLKSIFVMSFSLCLIMFKIPMSFSCAFVQRYPSPIWSNARLNFWLHNSLFIFDFISL